MIEPRKDKVAPLPEEIIERAEDRFGVDEVDRVRIELQEEVAEESGLRAGSLPHEIAVRKALAAHFAPLLSAKPPPPDPKPDAKSFEEAWEAMDRRREWRPDHEKVMRWCARAVAGENPEYSEELTNAGIWPEIGLDILEETDAFAHHGFRTFLEHGPGGLYEWRYMFEYARFLKAKLKEHGIDPAELPDDDLIGLKPFVIAFASGLMQYKMLTPDNNWSDWGLCFVEFLDKWDTALYPLGEDAFSWAVQLARQNPIFLRSDRTRDNSVALVAGIAYYLQLMRGDQPILLPTERIGRLFGRDGDTARQLGSRLIRAVRNAGVLEETKSKWNFRRKEAKEHRFMLESDEYSTDDGYEDVTQVS